MVVLVEPLGGVETILYPRGLDLADAERRVQVVADDLRDGVLVIVQNDLLTAGDAAVAEAVGDDERAGFLDEGDELRVVDLRADEHDLRAELFLCVRLAGFELLKGLAELFNDEVLGADVGHEREDVELVACDGRVFELAEFTDLGNEPADFIVLVDRFADGGVGDIDAVVFVQGL